VPFCDRLFKSRPFNLAAVLARLISSLSDAVAPFGRTREVSDFLQVASTLAQDRSSHFHPQAVLRMLTALTRHCTLACV